MLDGNPTDLAQEITDYSGFAICILEDEKGNKLWRIRIGYGPQVTNILNQVFIEWLHGRGKKPVLWTTLIECLKRAGHNELLKDMMAVFGELVQ